MRLIIYTFIDILLYLYNILELRVLIRDVKFDGRKYKYKKRIQ